MNAESVKYIKTMLLRFQATRRVHVMFSVLRGQGAPILGSLVLNETYSK